MRKAVFQTYAVEVSEIDAYTLAIFLLDDYCFGQLLGISDLHNRPCAEQSIDLVVNCLRSLRPNFLLFYLIGLKVGSTL